MHSWFFHVHLHAFSRTYFGFHVHLLLSRPRPVFTYTPSFSSSFGQTDFGHIFRVQMVPQECFLSQPSEKLTGCKLKPESECISTGKPTVLKNRCYQRRNLQFSIGRVVNYRIFPWPIEDTSMETPSALTGC